MKKEQLQYIKDFLKGLSASGVSMLELKIVYEMQFQDNKLSDDEFVKLYNEIEYAYFKLDDVALETIVRCALDNKNKILNDEEFSLRDESCKY